MSEYISADLEVHYRHILAALHFAEHSSQVHRLLDNIGVAWGNGVSHRLRKYALRVSSGRGGVILGKGFF